MVKAAPVARVAVDYFWFPLSFRGQKGTERMVWGQWWFRKRILGGVGEGDLEGIGKKYIFGEIEKRWGGKVNHFNPNEKNVLGFEESVQAR